MPMGRGVTLTFRCRAETVPKVRSVVASELRHHGIDDDRVDRLVLATAEACNNAIMHSSCASYEVTIDVDEGESTVTVSDSGGGFDVPSNIEMPEPHALSRRGLALMRALVDKVDVTSSPTGTTVVLREPLVSPAQSVALACR
jgi:serine/threonine-protein kinase RsbW